VATGGGYGLSPYGISSYGLKSSGFADQSSDSITGLPYELAILGKGFSFPLQRGNTGYYQGTAGVTLVWHCIYQLLSTRPGERRMLPEFGSRLMDLVFEPADAQTQSLAKVYIQDALEKWEPRIQVLGISFRIEDNSFFVELKCLIKVLHMERNFVFPFWKVNQ